MGIDHRWNYDNSGIWKRSYQNVLQYGGPVLNFAFAGWEGGETRLGKTAWQSVDSMAMAGVGANLAKPVFGRNLG